MGIKKIITEKIILQNFNQNIVGKKLELLSEKKFWVGKLVWKIIVRKCVEKIWVVGDKISNWKIGKKKVNQWKNFL